MNFLGHSFFALNNDSDLENLGNILGDFYKGIPSTLDIPQEIISGIIFHRKLDKLTDKSMAFVEGLELLKDFKPYNGVILDVFYDHFLSKNWKKLTKVSMDIHSKNIYSVIEKNLTYIPIKHQKSALSMINHNWFVGYSKLDFIKNTLKYLSQRPKRKNNIDLAFDRLIRDYDLFEENFFKFSKEVLIKK